MNEKRHLLNRVSRNYTISWWYQKFPPLYKKTSIPRNSRYRLLGLWLVIDL